MPYVKKEKRRGKRGKKEALGTLEGTTRFWDPHLS
jgi:hypothetical protein